MGGGTNAGMGKRSEALVRGKANSKACHLLNFNPPLIVESTPWAVVVACRILRSPIRYTINCWSFRITLRNHIAKLVFRFLHAGLRTDGVEHLMSL